MGESVAFSLVRDHLEISISPVHSRPARSQEVRWRHCHTKQWQVRTARGRAGGTQPVSYARHQFPPEIICHAVWLYLRFTLSYRDVEELLAERGVSAAYESVRRWVLKFGPAFAQNLRRQRPRPASRW